MTYTVTYINQHDQLATEVVTSLLQVYEIAEAYGVNTVTDSDGKDLTVAVRSVLNDRFPW